MRQTFVRNGTSPTVINTKADDEYRIILAERQRRSEEKKLKEEIKLLREDVEMLKKQIKELTIG